jgi:hypothetical protein
VGPIYRRLVMRAAAPLLHAGESAEIMALCELGPTPVWDIAVEAAAALVSVVLTGSAQQPSREYDTHFLLLTNERLLILPNRFLVLPKREFVVDIPRENLVVSVVKRGFITSLDVVAIGDLESRRRVRFSIVERRRADALATATGAATARPRGVPWGLFIILALSLPVVCLANLFTAAALIGDGSSDSVPWSAAVIFWSIALVLTVPTLVAIYRRFRRRRPTPPE